MKITKDALLLASAVGGGQVKYNELGWPFIVQYVKLLSVDGGKLNQHEDVTGGLQAYVTGDTMNKSELVNAGWSSCTYSDSARGVLEPAYRIDMTNIAKFKLHYASDHRSDMGLQYRVNDTDTWSTLDATRRTWVEDTIMFDTSDLTGFMYIRFYNNSINDATRAVIDEISVVPGPYLYRQGDEVAGLTGGWFSPPTAPTNPNLAVTMAEDYILATVQQGATVTDYANVLATRELVDLADVTAIHCVVTNTNQFMVPTVRLYDENWARIATGRGSSLYASYTAPTNVSIDVSSFTGKYHICLGTYSYNPVSEGKSMSIHSVYMEKAAS